MAPSFRRIDEETIYEGYAIRVAVGTFEGPDGRSFTRDLVRHPGAVAVVPLHADGTVTLVRQYRAPLDAEVLEIPAGIRDVDGEPPEQTAARELAEEVGLRAGSLRHLVSFHNAVGFSDELVVVYVGEDLDDVERAADGIEEQSMAIERHSLDDLAAMIERGEVTDGKTVVAVAMLRDAAG